jgi:hypothetical protein
LNAYKYTPSLSALAVPKCSSSELTVSVIWLSGALCPKRVMVSPRFTSTLSAPMVGAIKIPVPFGRGRSEHICNIYF